MILLVTRVVEFLSLRLPTYVRSCLVDTLYMLVTDLLFMAMVSILGCRCCLRYVRYGILCTHDLQHRPTRLELALLRWCTNACIMFLKLAEHLCT